jgi:hypothetical protein
MPNIVRNERSLWAQRVASDWRTISMSIRMLVVQVFRSRPPYVVANPVPCVLVCSTGWGAARFQKKAHFAIGV